MKRLRNASLAKIGLGMVVGGLVGLLFVAVVIGSFLPSSIESPVSLVLTYLVLVCVYGGLALLLSLALLSGVRECGWRGRNGRQPEGRQLRSLIDIS